MNIRPTVFPLTSDQQNPAAAQNTATQLTERYKNMLGSQAAGQNVGLFYQLEQSAQATGELEKTSGTSSDVSRYGMNGRPIEAGGVYA